MCFGLFRIVEFFLSMPFAARIPACKGTKINYCAFKTISISIIFSQMTHEKT